MGKTKYGITFHLLLTYHVTRRMPPAAVYSCCSTVSAGHVWPSHLRCRQTQGRRQGFRPGWAKFGAKAVLRKRNASITKCAKNAKKTLDRNA